MAQALRTLDDHACARSVGDDETTVVERFVDLAHRAAAVGRRRADDDHVLVDEQRHAGFEPCGVDGGCDWQHHAAVAVQHLGTRVLHAMRIGRTTVQPQHRGERERRLGELFELCLGFGELFAGARQRLRQRMVLRLQAVVQLRQILLFVHCTPISMEKAGWFPPPVYWGGPIRP